MLILYNSPLSIFKMFIKPYRFVCSKIQALRKISLGVLLWSVEDKMENICNERYRCIWTIMRLLQEEVIPIFEDLAGMEIRAQTKFIPAL